MTDLFDRVPPGFSAAIGFAYELLPARVAESIHPRFLCGVSPIFAGLHSILATPDGRSYHDTGHVCYPEHQTRPRADRQTTVILPRTIGFYFESGYTALHELGHVFDEATGFSIGVPTTTPYSKTNHREAFAEAFTLTLHPGYPGWRDYLAAEAFRPLHMAMGLTA